MPKNATVANKFHIFCGIKTVDSKDYIKHRATRGQSKFKCSSAPVPVTVCVNSAASPRKILGTKEFPIKQKATAELTYVCEAHYLIALVFTRQVVLQFKSSVLPDAPRVKFAQRSEERRPGNRLSDVGSLLQVQFVQELLLGDLHHQPLLRVSRYRRQATGGAARGAADPEPLEDHGRQEEKRPGGRRHSGCEQ